MIEFSYFLIPLLAILYIRYEEIRTYIQYLMIYIAILGTYEAITRKTKIPLVLYLGSIFCHLLLLLTLKEFKEYGKSNMEKLSVLILSVLFIKMIKYWPYENERGVFITGMIMIHIILSIAHGILNGYL